MGGTLRALLILYGCCLCVSAYVLSSSTGDGEMSDGKRRILEKLENRLNAIKGSRHRREAVPEEEITSTVTTAVSSKRKETDLARLISILTQDTEEDLPSSFPAGVPVQHIHTGSTVVEMNGHTMQVKNPSNTDDLVAQLRELNVPNFKLPAEVEDQIRELIRDKREVVTMEADDSMNADEVVSILKELKLPHFTLTPELENNIRVAVRDKREVRMEDPQLTDMDLMEMAPIRPPVNNRRITRTTMRPPAREMKKKAHRRHSQFRPLITADHETRPTMQRQVVPSLRLRLREEGRPMGSMHPPRSHPLNATPFDNRFPQHQAVHSRDPTREFVAKKTLDRMISSPLRKHQNNMTAAVQGNASGPFPLGKFYRTRHQQVQKKKMHKPHHPTMKNSILNELAILKDEQVNKTTKGAEIMARLNQIAKTLAQLSAEASRKAREFQKAEQSKKGSVLKHEVLLESAEEQPRQMVDRSEGKQVMTTDLEDLAVASASVNRALMLTKELNSLAKPPRKTGETLPVRLAEIPQISGSVPMGNLNQGAQLPMVPFQPPSNRAMLRVLEVTKQPPTLLTEHKLQMTTLAMVPSTTTTTAPKADNDGMKDMSVDSIENFDFDGPAEDISLNHSTILEADDDYPEPVVAVTSKMMDMENVTVVGSPEDEFLKEEGDSVDVPLIIKMYSLPHGNHYDN